MSLPSGYTRLEYIESTGTQYIDTGFKPNNNTRVVLDFEPTVAYSSIVGIFGIRDTKYATAANMFIFWNNGTNTFRTDYFGTNKTMTVSTLLVRQTVDKDKNLTTIGSVSASNTASKGQCSNNLYLFCTNDAGTANYFAKLKLYSCQIYNNGTLIRDYIPCQTTSGVAGLWDNVNSKFYQNAKTGSFITGGMPKGTHKTLVNGTVREVKGGKCLVNGTVYNIKKGRTLINGTGYDITFAPPYDPVFANNTWEQIIEACHNNEVPDTWKVADHKPMTINGVDYQIDIIGKYHDDYSDGSGKAPLTFQMHDCYGELKNMNSSNTNNGGWTSCTMRSTYLPAILAKMPTEVQNGIREVNKLTSAGSQSATINTTADKLFLLSEIEIYGSAGYSKSGEGTKYDFYRSSNKVKYQNGNYAIWWERSPVGNNSTDFCDVVSDYDDDYGYPSCDTASFTRGVAFAFCF